MTDDDIVLDPETARTLWTQFAAGEPRAQERLLSAHYREFREVARRVLNGDADRLQIQPTDLAHEAAIRLLGLDRVAWRDRTHFLALSAKVMRQTLLDEVRRYKSAKRTPPQVDTMWIDPAGPRSAIDVEVFDDALRRLAQIDPERARIVELRFYAGLTLEEVAQAEQLSESTVQRRWRSARAWLLKALDEAA
jgi:RNA polymerase sigma factor (TIGR02999 family)